ncbi:MAG: hypothetical protein GEV03_21875 [Streptosporangiales bacterium]|nr:hypothetical protein [Streptosporangiales bacterium]
MSFHERLDLLERLAARLETANVPAAVKRYVPNAAPSSEADNYMPVLRVGGDWRWVKCLYWGGVPMFTYPDSITRYSTDDAGIERLASLIAMEWHDHRARQLRDSNGGNPASPQHVNDDGTRSDRS